MKYMGSKYLIWKHIQDIILNDYGEKYFNYVEPFCGGCNSIYQVETIKGGKRIASDINPYLIALFKGLIKNKDVIYPISKDLYLDARIEYKKNSNQKYSNFDLGWIGFMASFRGKFFDSYTGNNVESRIIGRSKRNYIDDAIRNIIRQLDGLKDVEFYCCSYDELTIPLNSIIYCDPPYKNTSNYNKIVFDYDKFYDWCYKEYERGNKIFVSEYDIPDSRFKEIWSGKARCTLNRDKGIDDRIEKLFTI